MQLGKDQASQSKFSSEYVSRLWTLRVNNKFLSHRLSKLCHGLRYFAVQSVVSILMGLTTAALLKHLQQSCTIPI